MQTEYLNLSLTKHEALALLESLATKFVIEDEVRSQQGLEAVPLPPVLARLSSLLNVAEGDLEKVMDRSADGLWEYSWYVFTSEWAWYRAQQDALRQMKIKNVKTAMEHPDFRRRAETFYRKNFEKYAKEIDMEKFHAEKTEKTEGHRRRD